MFFQSSDFKGLIFCVGHFVKLYDGGGGRASLGWRGTVGRMGPRTRGWPEKKNIEVFVAQQFRSACKWYGWIGLDKYKDHEWLEKC